MVLKTITFPEATVRSLGDPRLRAMGLGIGPKWEQVQGELGGLGEHKSLVMTY